MKNSPIFLSVLLCTMNLHAQTDVSGTISNETWTKDNSPYRVIGDIQVAGLEIQPGVTVLFTGNYIFEVAGILTAVGTEQEPILFTADSTVASWKGILFQNTVPGSEMSWCIVEDANSSGIRIIDSFPSLNYCIIRNNQTANSGGGLKITLTISGNLEILGCAIENNTTSTNYTVPASDGGGIWVSSENAIVRFINCIIKDNSAFRGDGNVVGGGGRVSGNVEFILCTIQGNSVRGAEGIPGGSSSGRGGGVYITNGPVTFTNSVIIENSATGTAPGGMQGNAGFASGGGIHINNGPVTFINSILDGNTASSTHGTEGGGMFTKTAETVIQNSTLVRNIPHAIHASQDTVKVVNSILYFNNNNNSQVTGNVVVTYSDVQGGLPGEGNINFNPVLQSDTTAIIVEGSPAIDAGNPDPSFNDVCFPPSSGGERNDMGAHGGPGACEWPLVTSVDDMSSPEPTDFRLEQNYPNPFNPETTILYDLSKTSDVQLSIYNLLGQNVRTLITNRQFPGSYQIVWDGRNDSGFPVSSGIYMYRLRVGNFVVAKKMLLIR